MKERCGMSMLNMLVVDELFVIKLRYELLCSSAMLCYLVISGLNAYVMTFMEVLQRGAYM